MRRLAICLALIASTPSFATDAPAPGPLAQRVRQIEELIVAEPELPDALFHPDFLKAVPQAQIVAILVQYHAQGGRVVRVTPTAPVGEFFGEYRFTNEKGSSFPVKLGVDSKSPHLISTLWFGLVQPALASPAAVVEKLDALPGSVSFALWRLGGERPEPLHVLEPDRALAIGSTFKLYVLGALVDAVARGDLAWDRVVPIRDDWKSWPSGALQDWPAGSPVTVHSLAAEMISVSDNTATDHLLYLLSRERVEAAQKTMGHSHPEANVPFLSTREIFRIKEQGHSAERVAAYLGMDATARRKWLDGTIAGLARDEFGGIDQLSPTAVDRVEWFASAADLCRAVDWLRRASESGAAAPARGILGINRGLEFSDADWSYVGYKGGSEPGVLNMTWLLERKDGAWFALSAGWNDPAGSLAQNEFFALLQSLIEQIARP